MDKPISNFKRIKIIELHNKDIRTRTIAKIFKITKYAVEKTIRDDEEWKKKKKQRSLGLQFSII